MAHIAVVPGSFDPVTLGHLDVITRAAALVDELHVVVVHNPDKTSMIPAAERLRLITASLAEVGAPSNIVVASWSMGLLVDYCREVGANMLIKGIRTQVDLSYETPMSLVNRNLANVETLFMLPNPEHAHVSSTLVRQVASLGGDVSPYVPAVVAEFLRGQLAEG
ncbi:MAG: pantetheine-phosphate adenylyltransferase [Microbacteriaceae bacterium]